MVADDARAIGGEPVQEASACAHRQIAVEVVGPAGGGGFVGVGPEGVEGFEGGEDPFSLGVAGGEGVDADIGSWSL